ncbi:MAG: toprim domain-containing protein, partial [Bacteroidia bacterium]|nr:toprim domain-containing protein [Bacteroidia bacterium]
IVEGEKTAEAAAKLFAGKYVVLSWYGGAAGVDGADFSPLKNRTVVVCPDNDGPGKKAAAKIAEKLAKFGVEAKIFSPPENLPEKWDWADFTEGPNQAIELLDKGLGQETDDNPFGKAMRVVGKRLNQNGAFEYIVQIPGYGVCFIEADKIKPSWLLSVHSQKEFWLAVAKWKYFKVESRGLIGEILCLMEQEAAKRPPFGATQIRGRGVWNDEGKTVLHLGETIMVDDKKVETGYCSPEAIYIQRPALKFVKNKEFDLAKVVQTFREVAWRNSVLAETIVGWAVAAPICGLLTWRPHIWITGPAGCGKSFVLQTLQNILHPFCFAFQSDQTTEAGIRQTVAEDAMPILFDEADPRPEKQKQFQSILALARSASSDESPNIVKGTPLHKQIHFQCRSMFAFASIVSQVVQAADKSRFCELEIVGPQNTPLKPQKLEKGGMLRFSYQRRKQILEAIQISKETFFELGLDARHADQLGTLAGAWCAATGQNPKHLDKWKFFVAEHLQEQSNAHEEAFEALLACKIEHKNETIGDVIRYIVQTNQNSPSVSIDDESKNKLSVFGVWINLRQNKIFVQPTNPYLAAYFSKHTPFGQNFGKVLGRYPGAQKHFVGRPWGVGKAIRCIAIPFELQSLVRTETQNQAPPPQF